jgi:sugar phosphate isomerase/epimerase
MATINGIDVANKKYLLRLDQGDFDLPDYLKKLAAAGYRGPIGLQCFSVPGDVKENLATNIATWRRISGQPEK